MRGSRRAGKTREHGAAASSLPRAVAKLRRDPRLAGNTAMAALLSEVRVHKDAASAREADGLGAAAFTRGGEIFLGSSAPPLDSVGGVELLRHELGHVVQQVKARGQTGSAINMPGDAFEIAAETGSPSPESAPPAIQRQFADDKLAHFPEIFDAVKTFLEGLKQKNKGALVIDATARQQLRTLAKAPGPDFKGKGIDPKSTGRVLQLDTLLDGWHSGDPAALARQIAKILPSSMDPALLESIRPLEVEAKKKGAAKLLDAIEKTTPNPDTKLPQQSNEDKQKEMGRSGDIGEHVVEGVPVGQIPDVVGEMGKKAPPKPKGWKRPKRDQKDTPAPQADSSPKADRAPDAATAQAVPAPDAAKPEQGGLGVLPGYVDTAIEQAQEMGKTTADLVLGESLKAQQEVVFGQVQHLLQMHAKDAAGKVTAMNVYFGGKLAKTVTLGAKK